MTIETARLTIRMASVDEMEELVAAQTDPELKQAYSEMLGGCLEHPDQAVWYAVHAIELRDGTRVGDLSFKGLAPDGSVEIGYGIDEAYRGQGYATEAVLAAVAWALEQPGVVRVEAETDADNHASQQVLRRCGFKECGIVGEEGPRFART